jgi:SAM-dependent methyltransferase
MAIDFHRVVREFPGRLYKQDCAQFCSGVHKCCAPGQAHPLLPGEGAFLSDHGFEVSHNAYAGVDVFICEGKDKCPGAFRPVVCRTFPVHPGKHGLKVDPACSEHRWMSWEFIMQMDRMWRYFIGADPRVPLWIAQFEELVWSKKGEVDVYKLVREFDKAYSERMGDEFRGDARLALLTTGWVYPGDRVLDAGGGKGDGVALLRERGFDAVNFDVNAALIGESGGILGDVRGMPFDSNSFDVVFCFDVLEHLDDPEVAVREMLRVSRDRVIVYVTTLEQGNNLFLDITHRIFWPFARWLEMFDREAEIVDVDWSHTGALLVRKGRDA